MINIVFALFLSLVLASVENILLTVGVFSITAVLNLLLYRRIRFYTYLALFIPTSIAIDSGYHLYLGTTLIAIFISILVYQGLKRFTPFESIQIRVPGLFLSLFIYHFVFYSLVALRSDFSFGFFQLEDLVKLAVKALVELFLLMLLQYLSGILVGTGEDKLKLKA